MTREAYFNMCEQLGQEPDESMIPPDWDDFPWEVQVSINIFNSLGDRVYPDIGYVGKDYTNLPILLNIFGVEDTELTIDVLQFLDSRAIKASAEKLKQEHDKLKRKSSGK